jgi:hypothetical protein
MLKFFSKLSDAPFEMPAGVDGLLPAGFCDLSAQLQNLAK